jgi:hypothetical protein
MPDLDMTTRAIITAGAIVAVLGGWWRWVRPRYRKAKRDSVAIRDVLLGREAQRDTITQQETSPAIPGIGQRMSTVEHALVTFAENRHDLDSLIESRANHEDRIKKLEDASVERVVTRAESAAAWRAVEAVANAQPDVDAEQPDL